MKSGAIRFLMSGCLWGAWIMNTGASQLVMIESIQPKTSKTVVEMTAEELKRHYSELSTLRFNADQGSLDLLLKNAGESIEIFFRDLANISCKEKVHYRIISKKSPFIGESHREFYYLILPRQAGFPWTEDRVDKNGRPVQNDPRFCISKGYAYTCVYLHPDHQKGSVFRCLGRDKKGAYVLAFAQKPEAGDYLTGFVNKASGAEMQFLVQGFVWLDSESRQITRMKTHMLVPNSALMNQTTDIYYQETRFEKMSQSFWLPKEVTITWSFPAFIYINQHKYSDFRLFSVEANYILDKPQAKKP